MSRWNTLFLPLGLLFCACQSPTPVGVILYEAPQPSACYYLSPDGSDENDGLSEETAWRSIAHAVATIEVPARVHMLAGHYWTERVNLWESEDLEFFAEDSVTVHAEADVQRLFHLATPAEIVFRNVRFHGEGAEEGFYFRDGPRRFENCHFCGFAESCIKCENAAGFVLIGCRFGSLDAPLGAIAAELWSTPGCLLVDNRFHFDCPTDQVLLVYCDHSEISGNAFGDSICDSRSGGWALRAVECTDLMVSDNEFWMSEGSALGVWAVAADASGVVVRGNRIRFSVTQDFGYGICLGSETPQEHALVEPVLEWNEVILPLAEDSYFHNLFAGYSVAPRIANNHSSGGGYGLGVKGNSGALVEGNLIEGPARQCLIDKAGSGCLFRRNEMHPREGRVAGRVTDDLEAGVPVQESIWRDNGYHMDQSDLVFEVNVPVDIAAQEISSDGNRYYLEGADGLCFHICGQACGIEEMRRSYGWDLDSSFKPDENPGPEMARDP